MGLCFSWLFKRRDWDKERIQLGKTKQSLQDAISETKSAEQELSMKINDLKEAVNRIAARSSHMSMKNGKKTRRVVVTPHDRSRVESMLMEISLKENQRAMNTSNMNIFNKSYTQVSNYLMQQDALKKMSVTMEQVSKVGIDIDEMERDIEKASATSDKLDMASEAVNDSLASAGEAGSTSGGGMESISAMATRLFQQEIPFAEVVSFGHANVNAKQFSVSMNDDNAEDEELSSRDFQLTEEDEEDENDDDEVVKHKPSAPLQTIKMAEDVRTALQT